MTGTLAGAGTRQVRAVLPGREACVAYDAEQPRELASERPGLHAVETAC